MRSMRYEWSLQRSNSEMWPLHSSKLWKTWIFLRKLLFLRNRICENRWSLHHLSSSLFLRLEHRFMCLWPRILLCGRRSKADSLSILWHWKFIHKQPKQTLRLQGSINRSSNSRANNYNWFKLRSLRNQ